MSRLKAYTAQQCKRIPLLLHSYQQQHHPEDMHQLRVCLKKLRSVVRYLRGNPGKSFKPFAHILRNFFREAGAIREAELQMQWLQQNGGKKLIAVLNFQKTIDSRIAALQLHTPALAAALQKYTGSLLRSCKQQHEKDVKAYACALQQQLLQQAAHVQPAAWHELRKLLKQLLYAWHWLENTQQPAVLTKRQYAFCDALQEAIGSWHDAVIRANWLGQTELFLHNSPEIRRSFSICWMANQQQLQVTEKTVRQQLVRCLHLFRKKSS